LYLIT